MNDKHRLRICILIDNTYKITYLLDAYLTAVYDNNKSSNLLRLGGVLRTSSHGPIL